MKNPPRANSAASRLSVVYSSRLFRWFIYFFCALMLMALISWLAVPGYLKKTLEQHIEAQTGRTFKVGEVSFNPLTLTVQLSHFVLYEADKKTTALSADNLLLQASFASIFRAAPVVNEIKLTHPYVHLVRSQQNGQDVSNFSDLIARIAQQPDNGNPLRYSVANIQVSDGAIEFDDQVVNKQIQVEALSIGLPFLSNFPSSLDIFVEPHLSAKVDGSLLELKGRTKPFVNSHETSLTIDFNQFDLTRILPFSPKPLPFKVDSAKFTSQLELHFVAQKNAQNVTLTGSASVEDVALSDNAGAPLLKTTAIKLAIHEANLLTNTIQLDAVQIVQPQIWASLNQQGVLNWLALQSPKTGANSKALASKEVQPKTDPARTIKPLVSLANFELTQGVVHWSDAANATPALALQLSNIAVGAQKISTNDKAEPAKVNFSTGEDGKQKLTFSGTLDVAHAAVSGLLSLSDLALADYQPYLNRSLAATLSGVLGLKTKLDIQNGNISLHEFSGAVEHLILRANNHAYGGFSADKIGIVNMSVTTQNRQAKLDELALNHIQGNVFRGADGVLNVLHMMKTTATGNQTTSVSMAPVSANNKNGPTTKPGHNAIVASGNSSDVWQALINKITLSDSNLAFADKSVEPAVNVKLDNLSAQLEQVSSQLDKPMKMLVQTNVNKSGKFSVQGEASLNAATLNVSMQNLAVATLQPYFTEFLNVTLSSGTVSTKGKLAWSAPNSVAFKGMLKLANWRSLDKLTSDDFLKWKLLQIDGIDVALNAQQQTITLGKIALNDFYARTILSENGQLNLHDVVAHPAQATAAHSDSQDSTKVSVTTSAKATNTTQPVAAVSGTTTAIARVINIGQISLNSGVINYTDNFIKPHYTMRMTDMKGSVGAIHSNVAQSAPIQLDGKVDDEAPISISGSLNPLFAPMLLDIKMTASGVDLPRLTSYSAKYAGYPIVKGKLSLDVQYHIQDNQLSATNALKLDQLTFGEKNDSPDATSLPVPFLVSLLTDQSGQINLDLPISGTINDPHFSVGGLIVKVLFNLLGKVITSPFALLAHSFGAQDELSYIEFASGSAVLTEAGKTKLDNLGTALAQRPALKLDIIGRADLAADDAGLRTHLLDVQIKKFQESRSNDATQSAISSTERIAAIERLYSSAKFDKPRNMIGFAKSLPVAEMEKMLIANIKITEDDLRALAIHRENAVRAYFNDAAHIAPERIYLIAPKLNGSDINDKGAVTRVDFELKM